MSKDGFEKRIAELERQVEQLRQIAELALFRANRALERLEGEEEGS